MKIEYSLRFQRYRVEMEEYGESYYVEIEDLEQWRDEINRVLDTPEENYK